MSQIEWFTQQQVFKNLSTQDIYLDMNAAHEQRNEHMIASLIEHNADIIEKMLRKEQQYLIPHVSSSLISPTLWAFAESTGVIETDMDQFCVFAVKNNLCRGLQASASDFIVQWLETKVLDNAPLDSLSYFYFWSVRGKADILARAIEKHPTFSLVNVKSALKFAAKQSKDTKVFASECKDFTGSLFSSLQRIDGAACFLKLFENLNHYATTPDSVEILERNMVLHIVNSGLFERKKSEFFKTILTHPKFSQCFEKYLDRGIPFNFTQLDTLDVTPSTKSTPAAHTLSDLAVVNSRPNVLFDLIKTDPDGVNTTLSNPYLASEFCSKMYICETVSAAKIRRFFNKIKNQPDDKNDNTFAHYFVASSLEHRRDYDQILKDLYAVFPQWRHNKNKRKKSPLDLLEGKTSQHLRDTLESKHLAEALKATTKKMGTTATLRKI